MASVVAFDARSRELSETEALDWLRQQPRGHAPANSAVLAERWGWPRQRVARSLRTWQAAGLVTRVGKNLAVSVRDDEATAIEAKPAAAPAPQPVTPAVEPPASAPIALPPLSIVAAPVMPSSAPAGSRMIAGIVGMT